MSVPYRTAPCPYRTVPYPVRTVFRFFTVPFFTASATVTVPFFSLTVRSAKRKEPLILTVLFLVFDREPYRNKMGTVIRLVLGTPGKFTSKIDAQLGVKLRNWA